MVWRRLWIFFYYFKFKIIHGVEMVYVGEEDLYNEKQVESTRNGVSSLTVDFIAILLKIILELKNLNVCV